MVASPLGYEVVRLGKGEEIRAVEVDIAEVQETKKKMPIDELVRDDLYRNYDPYQGPS